MQKILTVDYILFVQSFNKTKTEKKVRIAMIDNFV